MIQPEADAAATRRIAARNSHDLDLIHSHSPGDLEVTSPFIAPLLPGHVTTMAGKQPVRGYWRTALARYPELCFTSRSARPDADSPVLEYGSIAQPGAAEFMQLDPSGRLWQVTAHARGPAV